LALASGPPEPSRAELIRRGRAATVVVELEPGGPHATGFCVHPSGLFVTSGHAVIHPGTRVLVDRPNLIVQPGGAGREVLPGRLVHRLEDLDLAFIRVEGAQRRFEALPLGSETGLEELMDVAAMGVPFPRAQDFPAVHVAAGSISGLPAKDGRLGRIQFDAAIGPGFAGGPLLDSQGQVVGVILGRARANFGSGVGLAVPVGALRRALDRPVIAFTPPIVREEQASEPVPFEARAVPLLPAKDPLELELALGGQPGPPRRFPMTRSGETYRVEAALRPGKGPSSVLIDAGFEDGRVRGQVADATLTIAGRDVRLGQVRRLSLGPNTEAVLGNGVVLEGPVSGLGPMPVALGGQALTFDLARASMITVEPPKEFAPIPCTLIARRGGDEVARLDVPINLEGRACFEAMRAGRFPRPRRGAPITYVSLVISPGERAGNGRSLFYRGGLNLRSTGGDRHMVDGRILQRAFTQRGVHVNVAVASKNPQGWSFRFEAPMGQVLQPGDYPEARRFGLDGELPELDYSGLGLYGSSQISGRFVVWEIESSGSDIKRLAVDFVAHPIYNGKEGPPVYGMIRYNSTFE
jgi:S1-C subfamily serine protease